MKPGDLVRTYIEGYTRVYSHISKGSNAFTRVPPRTLGTIIGSDPLGYQYLVHFPTCTGWVSDESVVGVEG